MTIPIQSTSFIGREAELAKIAGLLARPDCRLLTLTGPGGIGKTRLALEASCVDFQHGAHFVPLQPLTSSDTIIPTIASALNFMFYGERDPKTQLLDHLRERQLLLVLDNFEHLMDGADLLPEILETAPKVKLLVTSRERLNLREEWVLDIHGLPFPNGNAGQPLEDFSSIQLFVQSARRTGYAPQPTDNAAVVRICRMLEGIPLAIELSAGWVRVMSCEQIAGEIERSLDILSTKLRNFPEKHRSMRAAFEHSWALLSESEKYVFMKLSVFRGGFTRDAGEKVTETSISTLATLVDRSLLRRDDAGRYSLQELLRQFADEQLKISGEWEVARDAHSAYYAEFLQQKWRPLRKHEQAKTLREIDTEYENIRVAWRTMVEKQKTSELIAAIYPLWWYSELRSRYPEAQAMFKQVEAGLDSISGNPEANRVIGLALSCRGAFYETLKRPDEGRPLVIRGLEILKEVGSTEDLVLAYHNLTIMDSQVGDDDACRTAQQSVELAKSTGDRWWIALAYTDLWIESHYRYQVHEEKLEVLKLITQAYFENAEACGDTWLRAHSMGAQTLTFLGEENYDEAKRWAEQSLALRLESGPSWWLADDYNGLSAIHREMGNYPEAAHNLYQSLEILTAQDNYLYGITIALTVAARFWSKSGHKEGAVKIYAFLAHESRSLNWERQHANEMLQKLESEVPAHVFAAAQQYGKSLTLTAIVREVMDELSQIAKSNGAAQLSNANIPNGPLNKHELEILKLVAVGLSNREIGEQLYKSTETVKWYLKEINSKLDTDNRTQAVDVARKLGLI